MSNNKLQSQLPYEDGLQVIGAGLPRTGTTSMLAALEILYGVPGYHMQEVFKKDTSRFWTTMQQGKPTLDEIKAHFTGYAHAQDAPAIFFWEKLLEAYPNAKVVMTTREFESWHKSISDTFGPAIPGFPSNKLMGYKILYKVLPRMMRYDEMNRCTWTHNPKYLNGDLSKESFKRFHEKWQKTVPEVCPKDKLLIFDVKQGWEPLCKFLGKPIPDVPFPNLNDTKQM
jgi:hypothetical protein